MRRLLVTSYVLILLSPYNSRAQESDAAVERAIEWMKDACVTGKKIDIHAQTGAAVSVARKGAAGALTLSAQEARGAVDILNEELKKEDNDDVRECMKPHIGTILKAILGNSVLIHQKAIIELEALRATPDGALMAAVAYTNLTRDPFEITLDYPPQKSAFAIDDAGNEYYLEKSTGMARRGSDPHYDLRYPTRTGHSTYLLMSPGDRVRASFLLRRANVKRRSTEQNTGSPRSATVSIGHVARPTQNFDPSKPQQGAFGLTATFSDVALN